MARIEFGTYERNLEPAWIGDFLDRNAMLPGGAKLDPSAFPDEDGVVFVASGTVVGRTYAEREAGDGFGPVAVAGSDVTDEEVYLVIFDIPDAALDNDVELYRHGRTVKVDRLPGWDDLDDAVKAWVQENYATTIGAQ